MKFIKDLSQEEVRKAIDAQWDKDACDRKLDYNAKLNIGNTLNELEKRLFPKKVEEKKTNISKKINHKLTKMFPILIGLGIFISLLLILKILKSSFCRCIRICCL